MKSERLNYKEKELYYYDIYLCKEHIGFIYAHHINKDDNSCEIGYSINEDYRCKGYATESLKAFIDYLINEVNFDKVTCECLVTNKASIKVVEKANMLFQGTLFEETRDCIDKSYVYSCFK